MEVEHVPYIFGSFNRRRQSHHLHPPPKPSPPPTSQLPPQSPSTQLRPAYNHAHSRSQPDETHSPPPPSSNNRPWKTRSCVVQLPPPPSRRSASGGEVPASCPLCGRVFLEPRVLECLHTFCTRCLQEIVDAKRNEEEMWLPVYCSPSESEASLKSSSPDGTGPSNISNSSTGDNSSGGSACESGSLPRSGTKSRIGRHGGGIVCPVCGVRTALSRQGVNGLPPNYIVQHRLVLSTLNDENTRLLCDLCTGDVTASHRCSECLINLCPMCTEHHQRHPTQPAPAHSVLPLRDVRQRGLMRVHRRVMCLIHPEQELSTYCGPCAQVACAECARLHHGGHACETAARAAVVRAGRVHRALQRARVVIAREQVSAEKMRMAVVGVEARCRKVEQQVERWVEEYRRAVEEHRKELLQQVHQIREEKLTSILTHQQQLDRRVKEAETAVSFTETLLDEGSDIELLTFVATLLRKLERYDKAATSAMSSIPDMEDATQVQQDIGVVGFLPEEGVVYPGSRVPMVYGVVTAQSVAPKMSAIRIEGLESTRVNRKTEVIIVCRDRAGKQLKHGGEQMTSEVKYTSTASKNTTSEKSVDAEVGTNTTNGTRCLATHVEDRRDGTYVLSFTPDITGTVMVSVKIRGQHVQESPLTLNLEAPTPDNPHPCTVLRPHRGTFHCCSWCSSGGRKVSETKSDRGCACGGTMPGGYQGCGHGHPSHPGRPHWSCCGSVVESGGSCCSGGNKSGGNSSGDANGVRSKCKSGENKYYQITL